MTLNQYSPLPSFCKVLSNTRLASERFNVDKPAVKPGDIIEVVSITSFGFEHFAGFYVDDVKIFIPTTHLEELYIADPTDADTEYANQLWCEVQDRIGKLPAHERDNEIKSLLNNITVAGDGEIRPDVMAIFCLSWLSTVRA